ncbi:DUF4352 domain-containing protein [Actinomadura parmotrematis]|uniref:DUF4352 domain-containing protein n=1 Tax=Actinomadura parmotrematis TaxID=2864039 RepID=A0ABS7FL64_9ACTN|nr:DUF4352 domain-containing protein [Actinomadura parmotrematis]MBW8481101.1 DUF4352 domain-containing protein [Actinomadura parmotrematis]
MRLTLPATVLALLALACATGCGSGGPAAYPEPRQTVREHERALPGKNVRIGELTYTALALTTGVIAVAGSHADVMAKGRYVRVRLQIVNTGRDRHDVDPYKQRLVTTAGAVVAPSFDAMNTTRAPIPPVTLARDEVRAFDLWFDAPADAKVKALRVLGDASSSRLSEQLKAGRTGTADLPLTG